MLQFDPRRRISVKQALRHPYLAGLHDEAEEPTAPRMLPSFPYLSLLRAECGQSCTVLRDKGLEGKAAGGTAACMLPSCFPGTELWGTG